MHRLRWVGSLGRLDLWTSARKPSVERLAAVYARKPSKGMVVGWSWCSLWLSRN